jgi:hypothetical protein
MTLRSKHIVPIVLAFFVLGIGGTMIFNLWQTTSGKVPATYTAGEFAGEYNPADIRGSYSFGDIEEAFAVPVTALAKAFAVDDSQDPAAFLCKSLEDLYGGMENGEVGTDSVRWFVALYTGLPYTPEEDTLLPSPSISVLRERLGETELETVRARTVTLSALSQAAMVPETSPETGQAAESAAAEQTDAHTESEAGEIKGKTTFGELQSWGVSKETIEEILGLPIGKAGVTVRDYCVENGIEFSTVKDALQKAADRVLGNPGNQ